MGVLFFVEVRTLAFLEPDATLSEIRAAYRANCLYRMNRSVEECKQFIQACVYLIDAVKDETRQGSAALRDNAGKYERALSAAESWLAENDAAFAGSGGGSVTFMDLSRLRD